MNFASLYLSICFFENSYSRESREVEEYKIRILSLQKEINEKDRLLHQKDHILQERERIIQNKNNLLNQKDSEIQNKDRIIEYLKSKLEILQ